MDTRQAYNKWALQYDTNSNKTRDLEALALRQTLSGLSIGKCLEIGCGTGKNTVWLAEYAKHVTAVDMSEEMLAKAKEKISSETVEFKEANILLPWSFRTHQYDLVTFSLVLEHIEKLEPVFKEASAALVPGGFVYVGELHPFKQYAGSKARFDTEVGMQVVECFNHHISDFTAAAKTHGFVIQDFEEFFDNDVREGGIPRIVTLLLRKA